MRPGECVIVALLLGLWGLSSGCGAVPSVGAISTALPLEARQAGTQPVVKILYYEGEPRWEIKYLLQAVADDERLQVSLLQRTAENKFYVRGPDDLRAGCPATREELGRYRILILGSIEASAFSDTQLQLIVGHGLEQELDFPARLALVVENLYTRLSSALARFQRDHGST